MAESIREQILAAMQTAFAAINATGGYQSNLVGKVYRDYQAPAQVDEDVAVIIYDRGDVAKDRHARLVYQNTMLVELRVVANEEDPAHLNKLVGRLLADVERKVVATETWGGLAVRTFVRETRPSFSEAQRPTGIGLVGLEVIYRTDLYDPYAAGSI